MPRAGGRGRAVRCPLIKDWFTQVAAEFPSPFIHIGADETFDLGVGRTRPQVQAQGYGPVYVDFLKQIHEALAPLNRRLIFWGDIGGTDPKAVASLPKDMIAVPWNYWDTKGFDKMIEPFAKAGIETWSLPATPTGKRFIHSRDAFATFRLYPRRPAARLRPAL